MKRQRLAAAADLAEGRTVKFEFTREGLSRDGFLVRFQGRIVAYENVCRHLPLSLDYDDNQFFARDGRHLMCRNHGAIFEPLTGSCVRGPCQGLSLKPLPIEVVQGDVWLKEDMSLQIAHAALTDIGRVRRRNEDNWSADPVAGIYIVSDGLGGHSAGGVASTLVVEALPLVLRKRLSPGGPLEDEVEVVRGALRELSRQVYQQTQGEPGLEGMGATVVLALVRGARALIVHLGDSRAYRFRGGALEQLTRDHSVVQLLIDHGQLAPEEVRTHPARGCVTRSVGMAGEPLPECRLVEFEAGDRLLLCSDGLVGMVEDAGIRHILAAGGELEATCRRLIDAANEAGGRDNTTALLVEWG